MPASAVAEELYEMWRDLDTRAAMRERRGGGYVTARCPSCRAFKRAASARCGCGYDPDAGWLT